MMIKPRVLKALLYANFSVFCNYLHGHDMPVQDFLTDEDMEDAKHNLFNNQGKVEDGDNGSIPVIRDEGMSLLMLDMIIKNLCLL